MAARAGGCRPIWACGGVGCTVAFFLGGWPCSGSEEKRVPSARCDRSVADTYRAAIITGIGVRVWSPAHAHATLSLSRGCTHTRAGGCAGRTWWTPKWALRASLTTAVVVVSGLRPGTSMINSREAGEPIRASWGGGGMRHRKLGSHTPPCHRRMVITTLFSVFLAALQRKPVLYHTRWLLIVLWGGGGGAYAACKGAVATGDWGGCTHWAGCGVWAGIGGMVHGAGGHSIGNDARSGIWPGGYWAVGGFAGWGAAGMVAAPNIRAEASGARAGRGAAGGGATAPGMC